MEFLKISGSWGSALCMCIWNREKHCYSHLCGWKLLQICFQFQRRVFAGCIRAVFTDDWWRLSEPSNQLSGLVNNPISSHRINLCLPDPTRFAVKVKTVNNVFLLKVLSWSQLNRKETFCSLGLDYCGFGVRSPMYCFWNIRVVILVVNNSVQSLNSSSFRWTIWSSWFKLYLDF